MNLIVAEVVLILVLTVLAVASGHRTSRRVARAAREFDRLTAAVQADKAEAIQVLDRCRRASEDAARAEARRVAEHLKSADPNVTSVGV